MQYTNKFNWPPELVQAITKDRYTDNDEPGFDCSASTLIAPTQMIVLKQRYPDKVVIEDVSDMFWRFLGSMAHACLEEAFHAQDNGDGSFVEQRLYLDILGKTLSGKMDLYSAQRKEVRDYKSTKVYKIMKNDYEDWTKQLNIYSYLLTACGYPVERLTVIPLLFDFKPAETYKKGYPTSASGRINLPLWPQEQQRDYIEERIARLIQAEQMSDEEIYQNFPCTEKEQWRDLQDYAIMKKGATRATAAGFNSQAEAMVAFDTKKLSYADYEVVRRMKSRRRCESYCPVRNICLQHRREAAQEDKPLAQDQSPCIF